jgi:hypothetical protein
MKPHKAYLYGKTRIMGKTNSISKLLLLAIIFLSAVSCSKDDDEIQMTKQDVFKYVKEQTSKYIAVYGSKTIKEDAFNRAYKDVKFVLNNMDADIKQGLLNSKAKILVVKDEDELEDNIKFFKTLLPAESIYTDQDGVDETLTTSTDVGLSNTKLELMYLCVYYALLTESDLNTKYNELKAAYNEAASTLIFEPGEAYVDGAEDEIHENASKKNALKYGTYLYNLYRLYFGDDTGEAGEFTITKKNELKAQNLKGYNFIKDYFE